MSNVPRSDEALAPVPALFVGIDWADQHHDVHWIAADGRTGRRRIDQSAEQIEELLDFLRREAPGGLVAIAVEKGRGPLHYALMDRAGLQLYLIDPKQAARYRESFTSGGGKADDTDAALWARLISERHRELKPFTPDDPGTRRLAELCQARRQLVDQRTCLKQNLTALLKTLFPLLLQLGTVDGPLVLTVAQRWADPRTFRRLSPRQLTRLFRNCVTRNDERIAQLVAQVRSTPLITSDGPVLEAGAVRMAAAAAQIAALAPQIETLEELIRQAFAAHPDAPLLEQVPGAGEALAPRLLAAFGSDRDRYANADEVAIVSGIAPRTRQSGQSRQVARRRACSRFLKQTFHEFADAARKWCPWSQAYYALLRQRGMAHHAALRKLARCWIRILYAVWKTRRPYNPDQYLAQLHSQNHPLLAFLTPPNKTS